MSNAAPARILVVDDDVDIREMIVQQLQRAGFVADASGSAAEARKAIKASRYDLLVLDLSLPDGDGVDLCREVRRAGGSEAIMMVTARGTPLDRVLGLELGADDYLTKPFEPRELLARIRNILRRRDNGGSLAAHKRYARFGPWKLDLVQRRLIAPDERLVILSSAEFRLLEQFVHQPHVVLSREELMPDRRHAPASDRSIDLQISRLRAKLEAPGDPLILTVRNEGYLLAADVVFE